MNTTPSDVNISKETKTSSNNEFDDIDILLEQEEKGDIEINYTDYIDERIDGEPWNIKMFMNNNK